MRNNNYRYGLEPMSISLVFGYLLTVSHRRATLCIYFLLHFCVLPSGFLFLFFFFFVFSFFQGSHFLAFVIL